MREILEGLWQYASQQNSVDQRFSAFTYFYSLLILPTLIYAIVLCGRSNLHHQFVSDGKLKDVDESSTND